MKRVGTKIEKHFLQSIRITLNRRYIAKFLADADLTVLARPQHIQRRLDRLIDIRALQRDPARSGKCLDAFRRPFDAFERLGHQLHIFGQMGIIFNAFANPS